MMTFGNNSTGVLGFGNDREVNELTFNEDLSHKQIIDFRNSSHVIARTIDGKLYCWSKNKWVVLGNGKNDFIAYKPKLNQYLIDDKIIDISCGPRHTRAFTNSGEVFKHIIIMMFNFVKDEFNYLSLRSIKFSLKF